MADAGLALGRVWGKQRREERGKERLRSDAAREDSAVNERRGSGENAQGDTRGKA